MSTTQSQQPTQQTNQQPDLAQMHELEKSMKRLQMMQAAKTGVDVVYKVTLFGGALAAVGLAIDTFRQRRQH